MCSARIVSRMWEKMWTMSPRHRRDIVCTSVIGMPSGTSSSLSSARLQSALLASAGTFAAGNSHRPADVKNNTARRADAFLDEGPFAAGCVADQVRAVQAGDNHGNLHGTRLAAQTRCKHCGLHGMKPAVPTGEQSLFRPLHEQIQVVSVWLD